MDLGDPGNDPTWGWGRVDSYAAVLAAFPCGDCDGDGNVDADDWQAFASCLEGPEASTPPGCRCADATGDGDVDLADFAAFQIMLTE
jgi:hypothetical protein